jgi:hypothetical protein
MKHNETSFGGQQIHRTVSSATSLGSLATGMWFLDSQMLGNHQVL